MKKGDHEVSLSSDISPKPKTLLLRGGVGGKEEPAAPVSAQRRSQRHGGLGRTVTKAVSLAPLPASSSDDEKVADRSKSTPELSQENMDVKPQSAPVKTQTLYSTEKTPAYSRTLREIARAKLQQTQLRAARAAAIASATAATTSPPSLPPSNQNSVTTQPPPVHQPPLVHSTSVHVESKSPEIARLSSRYSPFRNDDPTLYKDVELFYNNRELELIDWSAGMMEVRRLVCALRFLVEEKNIHEHLICADMQESNTDPLVSTLVSGAKTRAEYEEEKERLHDVKQKILSDKHHDDHDEYKSEGDNINLNEFKPFLALTSRDDFSLFVSPDLKEKEGRAYNVQWHNWLANQKAFRDARKARGDYDPRVKLAEFDPEIDVTEFEAISYSGLLDFLFQRAAVPISTDEHVPEFDHYHLESLSTPQPVESAPRSEPMSPSPLEIVKQADAEFVKATFSPLERARNHVFVVKACQIILRLRAIESRPRSFRESDSEFLNKIDNYLAILLFRRRNGENVFPGRLRAMSAIPPPITHESEQIYSERDLTRMNYWQTLAQFTLKHSSNPDLLEFVKVGLPADSDLIGQRQKTIRALVRSEDEATVRQQHQERVWKFVIYGAIFVSIVILAAAGLYGISEYSANYALTGVTNKLQLESQSSMLRTITDFTTCSVFGSRYIGSLVDLGAFPFSSLTFNSTQSQLDPNTVDLDRLFAEQIQISNSSALFIATEQGYYIGAVSKGALNVPQPISPAVPWMYFDTYIQTIETVQNISNNVVVFSATCMVEYAVNASSHSRLWSSRMVLFCINVTTGQSSYPNNSLWDPRLSTWYLQGASPNALPTSVINAINSAKNRSDAAVLNTRLYGEGWSASYQLSPLSPDKGLTFSTPLYVANTTAAAVSPIYTPNTVIIVPGDSSLQPSVQLRLIAVVGSNVDYSYVAQQMSYVSVGVTGFAYLSDAYSTNLSVLATSKNDTLSLTRISVLQSYINQQIVSLGPTTAITQSVIPQNCSDLDVVTVNIRFSNAELNDVVTTTPLVVSDLVVSYVNVSAVLPFLVQSSLPRLTVPVSWVLVTAYPHSDYFNVLSDDLIYTIILGAMSVLSAICLLVFARALIPDVNKLKENLDRYDRQKQKEKPGLVRKFTKWARSLRSKSKEKEEPHVDPEESAPDTPTPAGSAADLSDEKITSVSRSSTMSASTKKRWSARSRSIPSISFGTVLGMEFPVENYKHGVIFSCIAVLVTFLLIAFAWSGTSTSVQQVAINLMQESQNDLNKILVDFIRVPSSVQSTLVKEYLRTSSSYSSATFLQSGVPGSTYLPGNINGSSTVTAFVPFTQIATAEYAYDKYFFEMMESAQLTDGLFAVSAVYAIFANGDVSGASLQTAADGSTFIGLMAKDNFNGNCFTVYGTTGAGVRDITNVLSVSGGCVLDLRTYPFYIASVNDGVATQYYGNGGHSVSGWTSAYTVNSSVVVTATAPILSNGVVVGVFAVDVYLPTLSQRLTTAQQALSCFARYFVMQETGELIATSTSPLLQPLGTSVDGGSLSAIMPANSSTADMYIQAGAIFLNQIPGSLPSLNGTVTTMWDQPLGSPLLGSSSLNYDDYKAASNGSSGLNWIVVCEVPYDVFLYEFDNFSTLSTVFCVFVIFIILLIVNIAWNTFHQKLVDKEEANESGLQYGALKLLKLRAESDVLKSDKIQRDDETEEVWKQRSLTELMRKIRPIILRAAAYRFNNSRVNEVENWKPTSVGSVRTFCAQEGIRHISDSLKERDIITLCTMDEHTTSIPRRVYKLHRSVEWTYLLMSVIVMHICLLFFQPPTLDSLENDGPNYFICFLELACILFEFVDIVLLLLISIRWASPDKVKEHVQWLREKAKREGGEVAAHSMLMAMRLKYNITLSKDMVLDFIYVFVWIVVALDWLLDISISYSFSYYFPVRILLLLFRSYPMRRTAQNFLGTLKTAVNIVFFYIINLLVISAFSLILFRYTITVLNASQAGPNYYDFFRSFITTFVYCTTADNYQTVVYDAYAASPGFMLLFVYATVSSTFFILAMVIATFQKGFQRLQTERTQKFLLFRRAGVTACFALLDLNGSERLGWNELQTFINALRPIVGENDPQVLEVEKRLQELWFANNSQDLDKDESETVQRLMALHRSGNTAVFEEELHKLASQATNEEAAKATLLKVNKKIPFSDVVKKAVKQHKDEVQSIEMNDAEALLRIQKEYQMAEDEAREEMGMSISQFVEVVEQIKWDRKTYTKNIAQISVLRQWLQVQMFERSWYHDFLVVFCVTHIIVISLLGTVPSVYETGLYWILFGFFCAHIVEIFTRVSVYGFTEYWYYNSFHPGFENRYHMYANRFDLSIIFLSIALFIGSVIWGRTLTFNDTAPSSSVDNQTHFAFVCVIPITRIFALLKQVRRLFFTLVTILPNFLDLIGMLMCLFFVFGTIGVNLFANKFNQILQTNAPGVTYDSIGGAFRSEFEMLTGQGWSNIMYAGIAVSRDYSVSWMFIANICLCTLLFVNIFVSLVIDTYEQVNAEALAERQQQIEERVALVHRQNQENLDLHDDDQSKPLSESMNALLPANCGS